MKKKYKNQGHFVDGEKGGAGKSLFTLVLAQRSLDKKYPFILVEADRSNPDVAMVYPDIIKPALFTEDESEQYKADPILYYALENNVIVSLPSQVHRAMSSWIENSNLLQVALQNNIQFYKWFVCSGRYASVKLFEKSLEHYEGRIPHILVKNHGMCRDWSTLAEEENLQKLIKKYKVKIIDFPRLEERESFLIDKHRLNFAKAQSSPHLGILGNQRVKNFLAKAYKQIDSAGVFNES